MIGDGPAFNLSFFGPPLDSTRQFLLSFSPLSVTSFRVFLQAAV